MSPDHFTFTFYTWLLIISKYIEFSLLKLSLNGLKAQRDTHTVRFISLPPHKHVESGTSWPCNRAGNNYSFKWTRQAATDRPFPRHTQTHQSPTRHRHTLHVLVRERSISGAAGRQAPYGSAVRSWSSLYGCHVSADTAHALASLSPNSPCLCLRPACTVTQPSKRELTAAFCGERFTGRC